ncbi:hypothetical protein HanRHA438_Chr04g0165721 [Helianthus annuus]|nr:hypothetical protein HanRHA438_Chr04g0165721 [Helianthus annuus]
MIFFVRRGSSFSFFLCDLLPHFDLSCIGSGCVSVTTSTSGLDSVCDGCEPPA